MSNLAKIKIDAVNVDEALDALTEAFIALKQRKGSAESEFEYELTVHTDGYSERWGTRS